MEESTQSTWLFYFEFSFKKKLLLYVFIVTWGLVKCSVEMHEPYPSKDKT